MIDGPALYQYMYGMLKVDTSTPIPSYQVVSKPHTCPCCRLPTHLLRRITVYNVHHAGVLACVIVLGNTHPG